MSLRSADLSPASAPSLGTSTLVSLPSSPRSTLDGAIMFALDSDGNVGASDMENFSMLPTTPPLPP
eukprot:273641-Amphidinium_carterae.1